MIRSAAEWVFSFVCHQEAARSWAPGGEALALCQRCTGVYAGFALLAPLLPWMRFRPTRALDAVHALFVAQMVVLGFHWVPHPAAVRTLSGQLFIAGVLYFAWTHWRARRGRCAEDRPAWVCFAGLAAASVVLQALVRAPFRQAAPLLDALSLLGAAGLLALCAVVAIDLLLLARSALRRRARPG